MINRLQTSLKEKDKGFTLVELLVVVVIIGILAGIAIPLFLSQKEKGIDASIKSDLKNSATIQETYFIDAGEYAADLPADFKNSKDNTFTVAVSGDGQAFCVQGKNVGGSDPAGGFNYNSQLGLITPGACIAFT